MKNPLPKAGQRFEATEVKTFDVDRLLHTCLIVSPGDTGSVVSVLQLAAGRETEVGIKWDKYPNRIVTMWLDELEQIAKVA